MRTVRREVVYVISGERQGFFSLKTGKYVPVQKAFFDIWRKSLECWWYTLGILTDSEIILEGTREYRNRITVPKHMEYSLEDMRDLIKSRPDVKGVVHLIAYPKSIPPTEEVLNRILHILEGKFDT